MNVFNNDFEKIKSDKNYRLEQIKKSENKIYWLLNILATVIFIFFLSSFSFDGLLILLSMIGFFIVFICAVTLKNPVCFFRETAELYRKCRNA